MAHTAVPIGKTTKLEVDQGAGFVKFAEMKSLTPPKAQRAMPEATHTDSDDGYEENVPGLKSQSDVNGDFNFVTDAYITAALADYEAGTLRSYKITYPSGATQTFYAYIMAIGPAQVDIATPMTRNVTLKPQGKSTWA